MKLVMQFIILCGCLPLICMQRHRLAASVGIPKKLKIFVKIFLNSLNLRVTVHDVPLLNENHFDSEIPVKSSIDLCRNRRRHQENKKAGKCAGCIERLKEGREPACVSVCCLDVITLEKE